MIYKNKTHFINLFTTNNQKLVEIDQLAEIIEVSYKDQRYQKIHLFVEISNTYAFS